MNKDIIVNNSNNNLINNNNNDNNNYSLINTYLFYKIYKNIYIRNIILHHLKIFNIHYHKRTISNEQDFKLFKSYKYKDYLRAIKIKLKNDQKDLILEVLNNLPSSVNYIEFDGLKYYQSSDDEDEENEDSTSSQSEDNDNSEDNSSSNENLNSSQHKVHHFHHNPNQQYQHHLYHSQQLQHHHHHHQHSKQEQKIDPKDHLHHIEHQKINFQYYQNLNDDDEIKYIMNLINSIPETVVCITTSDTFNSPIPSAINSPYRWELIELSDLFNQPLRKVPTITLSYNLQVLQLGSPTNGRFNQIIEPGVLPPSLTKLGLSYEFNQKLSIGSIPNNVTHLVFGNRFNMPLKPGVLPSKLSYLYFGNMFNQRIKCGTLPLSLETLEFSAYSEFKRRLSENSIPPNVKNLVFGIYFHHNIQDEKTGNSILPASLTRLIFYNHEFLEEIPRYAYHLFRLIPSQLPVLKAGILPNGLKHLQVGAQQIIEPNALPQTLTSIKGCKVEYFNQLPKSVTSLNFHYIFNKRLECASSIIPNHIKKLIFGHDYNQTLNESFYKLSNLEYLEFGAVYNKSIDCNILPPNLKTIVFGNRFNQFIKENSLPESLTCIIFGTEFHKPIINKTNNKSILPSSLLALKLSGTYNKIFTSTQSLPQSLTLLELSEGYNRIISKDWLPPKINKLIIRGSPLIQLPLPASLNHIFLNINNEKFLNLNLSILPNIIDLLKIIDKHINNNITSTLKLNNNNINNNNINNNTNDNSINNQDDGNDFEDLKYNNIDHNNIPSTLNINLNNHYNKSFLKKINY